MKETSTIPPTPQIVGDQPQPAVTQPQPPPPLPSKSPFLWLGLGLLVVVLGGGYYLLSSKVQKVTQPQPSSPIASAVISPSTDQTANWKTYTNNKYEYTFKYRANLEETGGLSLKDELVEIFGVDSLIIAVRPIVGRVDDLTKWWLSLDAEPYTKIDTSSFTYKESDSIDFWSNSSVRKFPYRVLKVELKSEFQEPKETFRTFFIQKDTHVLEIVTDYGVEADLILSTFRFVDKRELRKIVLYSNPSLAITNLSLLGVYMVAKTKEDTVLADWQENLPKTLQELKQFYEREFPGIIVEISVHPEIVYGSKLPNEYLLADFLPEILSKSTTIASWYSDPSRYKVVIVYIDGIKGANEGGYGQSVGERYVVNPAFWLEDTAIIGNDKYGIIGSAHELGHGLGIPHPWDSSENTNGDPNFGNVAGDIMAYSSYGKNLMDNYFTASVKSRMIKNE